ncbi:hypothetical protein [Catalinimonas alkaloidigena]|uniref:hypothetical protein n=1 Tax=Catalinimonas alkaloidigena TaxID=1075417 RepID=UPI000B7E5AE3|nr:hypothetical protein [Catalinimonas alkaloidigena]
MVSEINIEGGKILIRKLDDSDLLIKSAFWFLFPETQEWRLVIVTPQVDQRGPRKVYEKIQKILSSMGDSSISLDQITLMSPHHQLNEILGLIMQNGTEIADIRFKGNVINGVLIEDAYLYRVNP